MPVRMRVGRADIECGGYGGKKASLPACNPVPADGPLSWVSPFEESTMSALSRSLLISTLAMLVACPSQGASPPRIVDHGHPVTLSLVDEAGVELPVYGHRGQQWVPGQPGRGYQVRLTNQSDERVLVVLSVDGVNAVTGQTAAPHQTGYVLGPWQSAEIDGWRKSMQETARFVFTDLPDSYAARTGRPDNVGVVGIAVFAERMLRPAYPLPAPPIARASGRHGAANESMADAASAPAMTAGSTRPGVRSR